MGVKPFQDDVAEWELKSGGSLCDDIEIWLERYISDRIANNISEKTVKAYREAIFPFLRYSREYENVLTICDITAKYVNSYIIWYQFELSKTSTRATPEDLATVRANKVGKMGRNDANIKVAKPFEKSLSHRLTVLKQLLVFISANNKDQHDFTSTFKHIAKIKVQRRDTKYLTPKEIADLITFMKNWPKVYKQYRRGSVQNAYKDALIVLLYCLTGARSDEVISLKLEHIEEASTLDSQGISQNFYIIKYHTTKGDSYRESAVHKDEIVDFIEYIRSALPDQSFFISSPFIKGAYQQRKMNDSTMYRFVTWALHSIGIKKSGRHIIRRGYATKELADGKDIAVVAMDLGHASTETTYKHYLKNNPELMMKRKVK